MKKYLLSLLSLFMFALFAQAGEVKIAYTGSTTTNMTGKNDAALFGLSADDWSIVGDKGENSNFPGLNKAGNFRLYWSADGSNTITVTVLKDGAKINKIKSMSFTGSGYSNVTVSVNGSPVEPVDGEYAINATSFVIGNGNTSNVQVQINNILLDVDGLGGEVVHIANTAETAYTVAKAIELINAGKALDETVYVKGIVSQVDKFNSNYKSIQYWISDDGTTTNQFECYSGKGIDGADFASIDDVKVGASVVVKGTMTKYNDTYEFNQNNQLVSYTAPELVYTLVGAYRVGEENKYPSNLFWGAPWDPTKEENNMVKGEDGIYTIEFKNVAFTELGTIQYKVVKNHSWSTNWGFNGENAEYVITSTGTYDVTFKFNPDATFENGYNVDCVVNKQVIPERVVADGQYYIKNPAKGLFVPEDCQMLAEEGYAFTFTFDETIGAYTITGSDFFAFGDKKWYVEGEATSCKIYYILDDVKKYLDISDRNGLRVNDGKTEGTPLVDANYTWQLVEKAAPEPVYTLVGAYKVGDVNKYPSNLFWGAEWDVTKEENNMVKGDNGIYTIEFKDVAFTELGTIQYKVVKNHAYANGEWGFSGNNAEYIINETGTYDITFKFNPDATFENGFNVDCVVNKQAAPEQTWTAPTIAGDTPEDGKDYKVLNVGSGKYLAMGKAWFSWGTTAILADEGFDATFTGDAASFTLTNKGNGKFVFTSGNDIQGDAMHADGANATNYGLTQMPDGNYHIHDAGGNAESPCWGYNSSFHATGIVAHADATAEGWNCEWIFIATDNMNAVENYLAKKALYDALIYAKENEVNTDEASAVYTNSESTIDELKAAAEKLTHATNLAVNTKTVAGATAENPVETNFVVNGTFDTAGVIAPWKTTGGFQNQTTATNQNGAFTVPFFENWNGSAKVNKMYQVIEDIPNGVYTLKIAAFVNNLADPNESQFVFANNDKTFLTTGEPTAYTVTTVVTNNKIEIGLEQTTATANWMGIDNVSLLYAPVDLTELINAYNTAKAAAQAVEGKMNKDVKDALERALAVDVNMEDADAIGAATAALTDATAAAKASVAAFANAANVLPKMKELTESTNVYTAEALAEYYTQWLEKYEAETLTTDEGNALQDPSIVTGWHASITVDNFLLSAWDTNPDFVDAPYYINTWSIEGDNDGSNFRVPFFEYWTGDGDALGEKTLTATMNGVEPGDYDVTAWVRVRIKNGAEAPAAGITMQVNEGEAVNVADGAQIGTSQFYLKEVTATGTVAEDGKLLVKFNVAADNNISWLSFKNVKFEKQEAPATTYTVTVAETQNGQVEVNKTEAAEGETVSVTVTPAEGYMVDEAYWTYGEGENVTKTQIGEPAEGNTATFIMPAANVTVTVTFKAVAAEFEKFYIMGTGTTNGWDGTTEMTFNEKTQAFEYTVENTSEIYIAFGDAAFTDWDDFNANHRYGIGKGNQKAVFDEAMQLQKTEGEGTLMLPAGKFNVSVTKDLLCTITEVVVPTHTWDFTQWSEATVTNLKADAAASKLEGWSDVEKKADAEADVEPTEASKDNCFWATVTPDENGELAANGVLIEELKGLAFNPTYSQARSLAIAVNYSSTSLGDYEGPAYLWLGGGGKNVDCFVIKNVKAGTVIKMGVETHKIGDARGVQLFIEGAEGARGDKLVAPDGSEVAAPTAYTEQTWAVPGEEGVCNIIVYNTKGCHIYFIDADIEYTYTVAGAYGEDVEGGAEDVVFGKAWDPTQTENDMVKQEDGTYKLTITGVELQNDVTVYYKVVKNHSWDESWGFNGENANYKVWEGDGKYTITFTFDPNAEGDKVSCEMVKETPTGITMLKAAIENGTVYNMNGQKVNKAQKGLYIINGRKVVIK